VHQQVVLLGKGPAADAALVGLTAAPAPAAELVGIRCSDPGPGPPIAKDGHRLERAGHRKHDVVRQCQTNLSSTLTSEVV